MSLMIGIIGAMMEEIKKLEEHVKEQKIHVLNEHMSFTSGNLEGKPVVFARAGIGKTFASSVATIMLVHFKCTHILFTGVAGGLTNELEIGDIVIAKDLVDYDMNCKNFINYFEPEYKYKLGEIPFTKPLVYLLPCDESLIKFALQSSISKETKMYIGRIATGSEFLTQKRKKELKDIWNELQNPLGVEMEGSAVAQICFAFKIPFLAIRAISDKLDGDANKEFGTFLQKAADNTFHIIQNVVKNIQ